MLALRVSVPIACWRKGHAREYLETERLPPPSQVYGFLLSLVGEEDRRRHLGVRVTAGVVAQEEGVSKVLRTVWRFREGTVPGVLKNKRPDYQELLTGSELVIWLDSTEESVPPTLEDRVRTSLTSPNQIRRFGGLSLGESTHLVDEVSLLPTGARAETNMFLLDSDGTLTLPVWVDHVGTKGTRYVTGEFGRFEGPPDPLRLPQIPAP